LWFLVAAAAALRVGYVLAQPAADPTWNRPLLDGAIYLDWARGLLAGKPPAGAYYQAPLYPWALWTWLRVCGERYQLLYLAQQALVVAAALLAARAVRPAAGRPAAAAAAALLLLYAPTTYFPSRPLAEALALFLLLAALACVVAPGSRAAAAAGLLAGLAALARANLLLLPPLWVGLELYAGRARRALVLLAGVLVVVAPVTLRNRAVSGHWVPVAANAGLTAFHGNGPGAQGIFTAPPGFSGDPATQREEARVLASARAGRPLDAVEADRFWGREALRTRLDDPAGTLALVARRALLLVDTYEHGLDYPPALDENPLRLTWRLPRAAEIGLVPLGLLLGLAAAGLWLRGFAGTGGGAVWGTLLACAATPLLFYVSSRYRLPAAAVLCLPAGIGLAALLEARREPARFRSACFVVLAVTLASLAVPSGALRRVEQAAAWSNRAGAHLIDGDLAQARTAAERAIELDPRRASARYNLGLVFEAEGRMTQAMQAYREALEREALLVPAAHRLAALLIEQGQPAEALAVARRILLLRPDCAPCWSDNVLARLALGDLAGARRAAEEAQRHGVALEPAIAARLAGEAGS
jgi:tetratricopeptide (TPR) repeat protein